MDEERAKRLVAALQSRRVMAHVVEAGVYEFGVRVVVDGAIEALWDVDGAAGLDAELVEDGVLIGFVPHVPGSEDFTEDQLVEAIATTRYSAEGLRPPAGTEPAPAPAPSPPPVAGAPPVARYRRRGHWPRRGGP
ncbi:MULTISPECIES: hypothetical protein [Streptomyces]|uniref:Uncharacterized protein n=1 Tax=Streptomyces tsukubensis (strain DSM 42081 / NBRC 108919 / NRRL 18488 / 9993) TaxID=1114943 RepID=I2MUA0_STRT9|nr:MULTISPECIES: hypothetical protein [Streptomyces]AZK92880.1 hypothetical protein B7R87_02530 [Streptomyces tsukubensis]EIF88347.1 hypothetical protein [Streptomyces tsukubensis NRRL18488]MYS67930.1 hypothetical protein [Streptomyces sp. SID5473]QKM70958.1 hypothetical protein STSU_031300 [Streptomyces tsukubensis NRRL18488]TAI41850.1 hypothetical protein EWI31_26030 [Streptomyces tsukubensis]